MQNFKKRFSFSFEPNDKKYLALPEDEFSETVSHARNQGEGKNIQSRPNEAQSIKSWGTSLKSGQQPQSLMITKPRQSIVQANPFSSSVNSVYYSRVSQVPPDQDSKGPGSICPSNRREAPGYPSKIKEEAKSVYGHASRFGRQPRGPEPSSYFPYRQGQPRPQAGLNPVSRLEEDKKTLRRRPYTKPSRATSLKDFPSVSMMASEDLNSKQQLLSKPPSNGGDDVQLEDGLGEIDESMLDDFGSPAHNQSLLHDEQPDPQRKKQQEMYITQSFGPQKRPASRLSVPPEQQVHEPRISGQAGLIRKSLPMLPRQLAINDFMTLDYRFDFDKIAASLITQWERYKKFSSEQMVSLLLFCVKNRANFKKIIEGLDLSDEEDFKLSASSLFIYLLENADDNFKAFLFNVCSQYMPIPLYARRYFSKDPTEFHCWTQALNVYEKQVNVISFSLANEQGEAPFRTTDIVNNIFAKSFQTALTDIDEGGVFIQLDRDCSAPRYKAVILKSGLTEPSLIENAVTSGAFDIILLHYLVEGEQGVATLSRKLKCFQVMNNKVKIYALAQSKKNLKTLLQQDNLLQIRLFPQKWFGEVDSQDKLWKKCWGDLKEWYFGVANPDYEKSCQGREQSLSVMLSFLKSANWITQDQHDIFLTERKQVTNMLYSILRSEEPKGNDMLPMNYYYFKIGRKKLKIREENADIDSQGKTRNLEQKLKTYKHAIKLTTASPLIETFLGLLRKPGFLLKNQVWITNILKGFYLARVIPIKNQIDEVQKRKVQNPQETELDKKKIINKLKKKEARQMFSLELLFREIYFLSRHHQEFGSVYSEIVSQQIQSAQPIELIDGDNLLISDITQAIQHLFDSNFIKRDESITVVSIVGPQSSGKSLLLKFLFGTQFFSSEGRCTKGVYFSLLKMKLKEGKFKYILLLDTEGIQSDEARDFQFDSRIIYFILCVSNIVLVCNKQEMNAQMTATLQLVIDNWLNAKAEVSKSPKIYVVMNKMNDLNEELLKNSCREILSNLEIDSESKIDPPKVFGIPSYFQAKDFGPGKDQVRPISNEFLVSIKGLRKAIVKECHEEEEEHFQPLGKWFEQAQNLWKITDDFTGLHQYLSLREKRDALHLGKEITRIVKVHLIRKEGSDLHKEVTARMDYLFENEARTHDVIFSKLNPMITGRFDAMQRKAIQEYLEYTKLHKFNLKLTKKYKTTIERHRRAEETNFKLLFQNKVSMRLFALSKQTGNQEIQDEVQQIVNQNKKLSEPEAERAFEDIWDRVLKKLNRSNQSKNPYVELNTYIRAEFSRLNRSLEREDLANEDDARASLENSSSLDDLRSRFRKILLECDPVYPLPEKCVSLDQLIEPKPSRTSLLQIPEGLISLCKPYYEFDLASMVSSISNYLVMYRVGQEVTSGLAIALFEAKQQNPYYKPGFFKKVSNLINRQKSEDYLEQVFEKFNADLAFLNLKFKASETNREKFHVDEQAQSLYFYKMNRIIMKEMSNKNNFTLLHETRAPSRIRKPLKFIHIQNRNEQNYFIASVSRTGYERVERLQDVPLHERCHLQVQINPEVVQRYQFSTDFIVFLKSLLGDVNMNHINNGMVQQAIRFLSFSRVFSLIEEIVAAQIIANEGEKITISPKEQLEGLLKGLRLRQQESNISDQVTQHEKVVEQRQEVCEQVLTGIGSLVMTPLEVEFASLNLGISEAGQSALFGYAQGIMARIWELRMQVAGRIPIMNFLAQKETERKLAVARMTCNDYEIDSSWARLMVETIKNYLEQEGKSKAHEEFKKEIKIEVENFQKQDIVFQVEQEALEIIENQKQRLNQNLVEHERQKIKEIVQFYLEPTKALKDQATGRFNARKQAILEKTQKEYAESITSSLKLLSNFLEKLKESLIRKGCNKPASEILKKSEGIHEDVRPARGALAQYFVLFASGAWKSGQSLAYGSGSNKTTIKEAQELPRVNHETLSAQLVNGIKMALTDKAEISNLVTFCDHGLKVTSQRLVQLKNFPLKLGHSEIMKNTLNQLINTYQGCQEVCPMCSRQCDQNHDEAEPQDSRSHSCQNGHQLISFGQSSWYNSKKACLFICEDISEEQTFKTGKTKGKFVKFSDLKQIYCEWSFESPNTEAREENRKKTVAIWNLIGPEFCEALKERGRIVYFVPASLDKEQNEEDLEIKKKHLILVLDTSSSMEDQPIKDHPNEAKKLEDVVKALDSSSERRRLRSKVFADLKASLNLFMDRLRERTKPTSGTRVTVITYDKEPRTVVLEQPPQEEINIESTSGGRDFEKALQLARETAEKNEDAYDLVLIYFMSHGSAPMADIEDWNQSKVFEKICLKVVAYGPNSDENTLSAIAQQVGGMFSKASNRKELYNSLYYLL